MFIDTTLIVHGGEWDKHSISEVPDAWLTCRVGHTDLYDQGTIDCILAELDFRG